MIVDYINEMNIWQDFGAPDNNVHSSDFQYPFFGDYYFDQSSFYFYRCENISPGSQIWSRIINQSEINSLISDIPQADWTQENVSASDYIKNKPSIPAAQIQSDWTQTSNGALDYIKNKPAAMSQSSATRSLNSAFQVSSTRWSTVRYSVDISTTVSLSGSQIGTVILETATNSGFTTGVQTLQQFSNGNSGTLVIGLVLTQLSTATLSGDVPPGNYVRLTTVNVTGTPTYTYQSGQEVLL